MNNNLSRVRFKQFWNIVQRCKADNGNIQTDISINSLSEYFKDKFSLNDFSGSLVIDEATSFVSNKVRTLRGKHLTNITVQVYDIMTDLYIRKIKLVCAPGIDGVMST
jgi:hypothetical protein